MTNQTNEAAERSAHVTRGEKPAPAEWPVVRMLDGTWKLKSVVALEARIAELEAALATARRGGMEEVAKNALIMASVLSSPSAQNALRSFADAIRATLEGEKKDGQG